MIGNKVISKLNKMNHQTSCEDSKYSLPGVSHVVHITGISYLYNDKTRYISKTLVIPHNVLR